jgi:hypothetical protein
MISIDTLEWLITRLVCTSRLLCFTLSQFRKTEAVPDYKENGQSITILGFWYFWKRTKNSRTI